MSNFHSGCSMDATVLRTRVLKWVFRGSETIHESDMFFFLFNFQCNLSTKTDQVLLSP